MLYAEEILLMPFAEEKEQHKLDQRVCIPIYVVESLYNQNENY